MNEDDSVDQKASFSGERGGSVSIKIRCILELVRGSLHGHCLTRTTDIRLDMRKFIFWKGGTISQGLHCPSLTICIGIACPCPPLASTHDVTGMRITQTRGHGKFRTERY